MQNSISKTLWGIVFIILGIGFAGKALGFFDFNPFFIGWWTMFILVPSGIGLLTPGKRLSSFVGFVTGMACLALVNSWIQWDLLIRLWIPFLFIVLGLNIIKKGVLISPKIKPNDAIFSNENRPKENQTKENQTKENQTSENQTAENIKVDINIKTNKDNSWNKDIYIYHNNDFKQKTDTNGTNDSTSNTYSENRKNEYTGSKREYNGILSGQNIQFVDEVFYGAYLNSILGNVKLDLRNAIFEKDTIIVTTCILGGIDIYVPSKVKVAVNCTSILGDVDNHVITPKNTSQDTYTIFINGTCILGGIDVKGNK